MKVFKNLVLVILLSYMLFACTKNNDLSILRSQNNSQVANSSFPKGIWEGSYSKTSRDSARYFSFDIQDNGSLYLLNESGQVIGAGSWILNDSLFNAYYIVYATQVANTITGEAQTNPDKLFGKWQYGSNYQDAGKWNMNRIQ